jgi:hypothetical protein
VQLADGSTERRDGARNWRNNNPGNIEYGDFAKKYGALGSDGRFAIFPSYDAGRKAKEALLFEGRGYAGMNIQQAIYRYAPPSENNSQNYVDSVAAAVGVPASTPLSQLNAQQRTAMLNSMEKVEGFKTGKITRQSEPTVASAGNTATAAPTTPGAPTAADGSVPPGAPGAPGQQGGGNVREAQSGATTRKMPISPELKSVLQKAALEAGVDVVVTSGGQPSINSPEGKVRGARTGSTRHDLGNAADLDLYVGGRILSDANPADIELKKKFVAAATAAGASGVGAGASYMGLTKIHVGFGDPAKWGGAAWIQGIRTGSGRPSATSTQMQAGNALSSASQQNAAAQMRQNQGPVTYNNNRVVNTETTVYQTASVSLRKMEQAFNPYNMLANAVTGRPLF